MKSCHSPKGAHHNVEGEGASPSPGGDSRRPNAKGDPKHMFCSGWERTYVLNSGDIHPCF